MWSRKVNSLVSVVFLLLEKGGGILQVPGGLETNKTIIKYMVPKTHIILSSTMSLLYLAINPLLFH